MKTIYDLRDTELVTSPLSDDKEDCQFLITAGQWAQWGHTISVRDHSRFIVIVPDFLRYARLASTGQAKEILKVPQRLSHFINIGLKEIPLVPDTLALAKGEFWESAMALVRFDFALISDFHGCILLHPNLSDFTWFFQREEFVSQFVKLCGSRSWGIATNQLRKCVSLLSSWGFTPQMLLVNWDASQGTETLIKFLQDEGYQSTEFIGDFTQWPAEALQCKNLAYLNDTIPNIGMLLPSPSPL